MTETDTDTLILPTPGSLLPSEHIIEDLPLFLPTGPLYVIDILATPAELARITSVRVPARATGPLGPRRQGPPVPAYLHVANDDTRQFPTTTRALTFPERLLTLAAGAAFVIAASAAVLAYAIGALTPSPTFTPMQLPTR